MASIKKRKTKSGYTWTARVDVGRDPKTGKRRQRRVSARTRRELEARIAALLHSVNSGAYVESSNQTVAAYLTEWLPSARRRVRPSSYRSYASTVERHIIPALGQIRVSQLRATDVQAFYDDKLDEGLSPTTVRKFHAILHRALADGVRMGTLARNVCTMVSPPSATKPEIQTWTAEEAARFIQATADDELGLFWHLGILTGLRRGEIIALRWEDIDFTRGHLAVRRTQTRDLEGKLAIGPPKSNERVVALPPHLLQLLRSHQDEQRQRYDDCGWEWSAGAYVFDRGDGRFYEPGSIGRKFDEAIAAADVPKIRLHDLRHSAATLMLADGVNVKVVQERLGHHSAAFTLDRYGHTTESMQAEAARKMAELLGFEAESDQIVTETPAVVEFTPETSGK